MKAVRFDVTIPGFLLAKTVGGIRPTAMFGAFGTIALEHLDVPSLPGPDWVELEVIACGICGSDVSTVTYSLSPALEPFNSFPAVLGHEILARVIAIGTDVNRVSVGERVSIEPTISCSVRGHAESCNACRDGYTAICEHSAEPGITRIDDRAISGGTFIGYHRDLPGGFGARMIAHQSQLHPVPDEIDDDTAVLTEPFSIAVHGVMSAASMTDGPVLVIGSGTIALATVWALRATGYRGLLVSQTKRTHEAELAGRLGASEVVRPGEEATEAMIRTGATAHKPIIGGKVFSGGGYPLIFDCVGSSASLRQSLSFAAARGRIVVLGCASELPNLDLSFLWARELTVRGSVAYAVEKWQGRSKHTFEITHELMRASEAPLSELVTHTYPLAEFRAALEAAADHQGSGAIKVVLNPG
jgi:threonine dehydrogenase-like Zn-dependent dehydrogenase